MTATHVNICVGGELEARAQSVLADLGLDVPTAVNMFLTQVVDRGTLPFEMDAAKTMQQNRPFSELRGSMEFWRADNFDESLEGFLEYWKTKPEQVAKMSREEMFDCARGQFNIPDNFDAPLEDFMEYME